MKHRNFQGLVKRFTKKQAELAKRISNDISEGIIDPRITHNDLRMAVSYWADVATVNAQKVVRSNQEMSLVVSGLGLVESAVELFKERMSNNTERPHGRPGKNRH